MNNQTDTVASWHQEENNLILVWLFSPPPPPIPGRTGGRAGMKQFDPVPVVSRLDTLSLPS